VGALHVAVVPVGRVGVEEIETAMARAAKVIHRPLELRETLPVPHGTEDPDRGQHRAAMFMDRLGQEVLKLKPGKLVGSDDPDAKAPYQPDAYIFVTDVDLYTAKTEGVLSALITAKKRAVISVRRQREAFYRRKTNPNRQRSRLVKEILRMSARLAGVSECADPACALAPSRGTPDIDTKDERYCHECEQRLFEGKMHI